MLKRATPISQTNQQPNLTEKPAQPVQPVQRMSPTGRPAFVYQPRTNEQLKKRLTQHGGSMESPVRSDLPSFRVGDGVNTLRVLPPTWETPAHYGFDVWIHRQVGSENATFICLSKMLNRPDPLCEEKRQAEKDGDVDYAKELNPIKRVGMWVVDRKREDESPFIWLAPWTVDRDVVSASMDPTTGQILSIDDPDEGFDFYFTKEGKLKTTKYHSVGVSRRATPLSNDRDRIQVWLDYVIANPIPSCLVYREYDYINTVFSGGGQHEDTASAVEATAETTGREEPAQPKQETLTPAISRLQQMREAMK